MPGDLMTRLDDRPVLGQSLGHVSLLRLDRAGGLAPGNKAFKLRGNLEQARSHGLRRLVSFGGAWSNHLHALAAVAREQAMESIGLVRGGEQETAMLADARGWGMQVIKLSREEYRRRNDPAYLDEIAARFSPCLVIPEGGANAAGVKGCREIAQLIREVAPGASRIVLPVGTGTTLAGIVSGLAPTAEVVGISALKGALDLDQRVRVALSGKGIEQRARWRILHDHHCGGFARVTPGLREFILAFEAVHGIPLDPVYTGKMLYAIHRMAGRGEWGDDPPILAVHTGGLQGRRGFDW
jgi:1-aminocyclopropane-1-carboxylate deaminase